MTFNMHTFSVALLINIVIQVLAISAQFMVNKTHRGPGLWLSSFIAASIGLLITVNNYVPASTTLQILISNLLYVAGALLLYMGIARFFEKKENIRLIITIFTIFCVSFTYYCLVDSNIRMRIIIFSLTWSVISFLICYTLVRYRSRFTRTSSMVLAVVFFFTGIFFIIRSTVTVIEPPIESFYTPSRIQIALLIVLLIASNSITYSLIMMVSQRLYAEMKEARDRFELIFHTGPDAALITDLESGNIVEANEGFFTLSGYTREELENHTVTGLNILESLKDREKILSEFEKNGNCINSEVDYHRKDGTHKFAIISATPVTLNDRPCIISLARDITERITAEEKLKEAMKEAIANREKAETAKQEKELLLKEVHHRIKNNMNTIMALLSLHSDTVSDQSAVAALREAGSRVRSMMILYDKLYRSESFREIAVREYIAPLSDEIVNEFPHRSRITINRQIDDFIMESQTLFLIGIITNELITNIMKYAFEGMDRGTINLIMQKNGNHVKIIISDNGIGLPGSFDLKQSAGFGLQLVSMLAGQLKGSLKIESGNGTTALVEFDV